MNYFKIMIEKTYENMNNGNHWFGSLATLVYEPRQIRKEAAVIDDVCAEM